MLADAASEDGFGITTREGDQEMSKVSDLHKKWSHDPEYRFILYLYLKGYIFP